MSNDTLRLSTAEREQASARLAEHFAEGRLDHDEYADRLDRIWAARTRGDLGPVFRDLPGSGPEPAPARTRATVRPRRARVPFPVVLLVVLVVGAVTLAHPLILLIGLAVWFLVLRRGCRPTWSHRRW